MEIPCEAANQMVPGVANNPSVFEVMTMLYHIYFTEPTEDDTIKSKKCLWGWRTFVMVALRIFTFSPDLELVPRVGTQKYKSLFMKN